MAHPHPDPAPTASSRRDFLKTGALASAALACVVIVGCQSGTTGGDSSDASASGGLDITIAGYAVDRVQALADGRVEVEGCNVRFERAGIFDLNIIIASR